MQDAMFIRRKPVWFFLRKVSVFSSSVGGFQLLSKKKELIYPVQEN